MNKCIYTLKSDCEFNEEHIIPAFLGGNKTLPLGYVSKEANDIFSKLEKECATSTYLALLRAFCGPGKRGKNKEPSSVNFQVFNDDSDELTIGYVYDKKPRVVSGITINMETNKVSFHIDKANQNNIFDIYHQLKSINFNDETIYINICGEHIPENILLFGFHNKKLVIAYNANLNIKNVLAKFNLYIEKLEIVNFENLKVKTSKVSSYYKFSINLDQLYRFYAKVAFNVATHINGQELINRHYFDRIRKNILCGGDFSKIACHTGIRFDIDKSLEAFDGFGIDFKYSHIVHLFRSNNFYYAIIGFYGLNSIIRVTLSDNLDDDIKVVQDTYICDWMNKKEGLLIRDFAIDYCRKLDEEDERRYKNELIST